MSDNCSQCNTQGGDEAAGLIVLSFIGTAFILTFLPTLAAVKLIDRRARLNKGFEGERLADQHLNQLMREGYTVYHELIMEGFNIDHAIVRQSHVFAVKTKAKSKRKDAGKNKAQVRYDGKKLIFHDGENVEWLEQTLQQALCLARWVEKEVGERVRVVPALCLLGWYVVNQAYDLPIVANPKMFSGFI